MKYDATLKKVFQRPPNRLLSHALGAATVIRRVLPTELISVQNLHPDLLFETGDGQLIHAELQGYAQPEFSCRNLMYFALVLRDYHRAPTQVVFWIGDGAAGIADGLSLPPALEYRYRRIDVRQLDPGFLLDSDEPGDWIFAILCNLGDPQQAVSRIVRQIASLAPEARREATAQLLILSGLRGLTPIVKREVARMPVTIDIHDNPFLEEIYQEALREGHEKGRQEGEEKGREEGRERGLQESAALMLLDFLEQRFGAIPDSIRQRIAGASTDQVRAWGRHVATAASLDEIFA